MGLGTSTAPHALVPNRRNRYIINKMEVAGQLAAAFGSNAVRSGTAPRHGRAARGSDLREPAPVTGGFSEGRHRDRRRDSDGVQPVSPRRRTVCSVP